MKKHLLGTNIILRFIRNSEFHKRIARKLELYERNNLAIVSIVTIGELRAISLKNNWGKVKIEALENILTRYVVADINSEDVLHNYALIDAFSQNRLPNQLLGATPRNMGENDIWIAATASAAEATLLTSDNDFDHLNNTFLNIEKIEIT